MPRKPPALPPGATLGIFTPSTPAYVFNEEKFQLGLTVIEDRGFRWKLGDLTAKRAHQGYRSGTGAERAAEFMQLYLDPQVDALIATIGGNNSSSMIPHLDFDAIARTPKIVCGYSDVTSLHLALLHHADLRTVYGPALMTWFSDWPAGEPASLEALFMALQSTASPREIKPFPQWSNHFRDWADGSWKTVPRAWQPNAGWRALRPGRVQAPVIAANLNTLTTAAGTPYFPTVDGCILLIEEMAAPFARVERNLMQLRLMGVFDRVAGLIFGKPEKWDAQGAPFDLDALLLECVGDRPYPIVSQFDLSHTGPMHTLVQHTRISLTAGRDYDVRVVLEEAMVS